MYPPIDHNREQIMTVTTGHPPCEIDSRPSPA